MNEKEKLMEQFSRYHTLWRESISMYEEWSKEHGLSYNSVMVLYSLYEDDDNCTQKMICQKWLLPKQTVNTILKDFERRGFVVLSPAPSDKRNKLIHPTKTGKQYAEKIVPKLKELELFVMTTMGAEKTERMNNDFELFVKLFREGAKNANEL